MDAATVRVSNVQVQRLEVDTGNADVAEALAALFAAGGRRGAARLPLAPTRLSFELRGVPTAVANALRRVLAQELPGYCLTFAREGFVGAEAGGTTDPFMADDDYLRGRLQMVPLAPGLSDEVVRTLRFALHATNGTAEVLTLYAGDLRLTAGKAPAADLFNPTHELAFLQPGQTLSVRDIRIARGTAAEHASYATAVRAVAVPLDLESAPRADTHGAEAPLADDSGYLESSLLANPRAHRVSCLIPAAPPNQRLAAEIGGGACSVLVLRLDSIRALLEDALRRSVHSSGSLQVRSGDGYLHVHLQGETVVGELVVKKETHTIGNLLARTIDELYPGAAFVGYSCVPHKGQMELKAVRAEGGAHDLVRQVFLRATLVAVEVLRKIRSQLAG